MRRSTKRILTTHVGSLARPDGLVPILKAKDRGQPYMAPPPPSVLTFIARHVGIEALSPLGPVED